MRRLRLRNGQTPRPLSIAIENRPQFRQRSPPGVLGVATRPIRDLFQFLSVGGHPVPSRSA